MSGSFLSAYWYRVAALRPRLRGHVALHRHQYRGEPWYLLDDRTSGQQYRFSPAAHAVVARLDGRRSVDQIWSETVDVWGDDAPGQDEVIHLLGCLHAADALICDVPPDTLELFRRRSERARQRWKQRLANPIALRLPLLDPDRWLKAAVPRVAPLLGAGGAALWLVVVGAGVLLAAVHWSDLTQDPVGQLLAAHNVLVLMAVYPLVKLLHELAHGVVTRRWGGEVHEAGIILIALMPVPYVDASSSSAFSRRRHRMLVSAAGIAVELFVASLALFVWLAVEEGWIRTLAYDVMIVGGVSTLLFNGNPLLRFDGYYVFCDLVDIPGLATRSQRYLTYLLQRHAFGVADVESPVTGEGERPWLVSYGVASFLYRNFILLAIALFVAERFPVVGVLIAALAVTSQLVVPCLRGLHVLAAGPRLAKRRTRAVLVSSSVAIALLGGLFLVPLPLRTSVEGVILPPERSQVRAGTDGFVRRVLATPERVVEAGDSLLQLEDPFLEARTARSEARLRELVAERDARRVSDAVGADVLEEEIASARAALERARERARESTVRSPGRGQLVLPDHESLIDRFVTQGQVLGYVADFGAPIARVAVRQSDIALVRERTHAVRVRVAERLGEEFPAEIARAVPHATDQLPSKAIGSEGGGPFAVDPADEDGLTALETVFHLDLALSGEAAPRQMGGRVYVLFDHGSEPLAFRLLRDVRRLFLRRFLV